MQPSVGSAPAYTTVGALEYAAPAKASGIYDRWIDGINYQFPDMQVDYAGVCCAPAYATIGALKYALTASRIIDRGIDDGRITRINRQRAGPNIDGKAVVECPPASGAISGLEHANGCSCVDDIRIAWING